MEKFTFLALGDSYTIAEGVPLIHSFPYQTTSILRKENIMISAPEVIAKTGWTTSELATAMLGYPFLQGYDVVTLLIGVNNQYRGYSSEIYRVEFKALLQNAIYLAGGKVDHVFVLSIPDYSITLFAKGLDQQKIRTEIQSFNNINRAVAEEQKVTYINITESTRTIENDVNLLAEDGLHPSPAEYYKWSLQLAPKIKSILS